MTRVVPPPPPPGILAGAGGGAKTLHTLPTSLHDIPLFPATKEKGAALSLPPPTVGTGTSRPSTVWSLSEGMAPPAHPSPDLPFKLASSFPPIPAKLVRRVQAMEFVEMRELLPDNIALAERMESLPSRAKAAKDAETREITAFPTWVAAFTTYIAIVAEAHPSRVKDMCAYMRLLTREALKYGGRGWATYDAVFRRNRAGTDTPWDQLDPSLHIAYIISQVDTPLAPCTSCNEVDHRTEDCALASVQPKLKAPSPSVRDWSRPYPRRPAQRPAQRPVLRICISWNKGKCAFPGACNFAHACASCRGDHQANVRGGDSYSEVGGLMTCEARQRAIAI